MPSAVVTDRRRATTTDLGRKVTQSVSSGEQTIASSRSYDLRTADASLSQDSLADDFDGPIIDSSGGKVLVDDYELLARARSVQRRIDFSALTDLARCQWKWKRTKENFTLFTRRLEFHSTTAKKKTLSTHQVLVAGEIRCSIEELARILRSTSDSDYNAVMKGIYKDDFIYGSIVHVAPGSSDQASEDHQNENQTMMEASQLTVKTGCFARANIFVRNEQWCFLEHFQKSETDDAFTVMLATLPERELTVGKIKDGRRVDQLHDLIAAYSVEKIPASESVRVLFHANFDSTATDSSNSSTRNASESMSKSRLMALAKGVSELPEIVRRRRLGVQKLADRASFSVKNSQCICCTKSLRLLTKKKRCYLCGYFVCDKDWSIQRMETRHGHVTAIRVCARCMECVDSADYADVTVQSLGRASIKPDQPRDRTSSSTVETKKAIATFLSDALANSTEYKKESVKSVIQQLVEHEQRLSEQHEQNRVASKSAPAAYRRNTRKLSGDSDDKEYLAALDEYFKIEELPLEKCVLANNDTRAYGIKPSEDPKIQPAFPVPRNETRRMSAIEQGNLMKLQNTDELNIICSIAAREMNCSTSIVTIVGPDTQLVLASNLDVFRMVAMPRNQSFCQHTVMDDKPLLVPHPEADVRFANLLPLKELGMKFYCGFPIVDSTNTVVGTVCCLDQKSHDVTRSQYSTMKRLAETASKFVQLKSQEPVPTGGRPTTKLFYGQSYWPEKNAAFLGLDPSNPSDKAVFDNKLKQKIVDCNAPEDDVDDFMDREYKPNLAVARAAAATGTKRWGYLSGSGVKQPERSQKKPGFFEPVFALTKGSTERDLSAVEGFEVTTSARPAMILHRENHYPGVMKHVEDALNNWKWFATTRFAVETDDIAKALVHSVVKDKDLKLNEILENEDIKRVARV